MRGPIAIGFGQQRSRPVNAARVVNLYAEATPEGSRTKVVLYGTPGQKEWRTIGDDTIRAGLEGQGVAYILSGTTLWKTEADGTTTACSGDLIPSTGQATLINNGEQIGLLVVPDFFVITDTTVVKNTSSGVPAVGFSSVSYIDGYGILTVNDSSGQFYITGLLDFSTIDPLDVASAESSPDGLVRVLVDHREIWLFGTKTIEPWSNTGASPFPLERVPGALLERGCAAAQSCAKMDNSVFWLGDDRIIYRADGYQPVRISTHAIEEILRTGTVSDAYGMTYFMGGHHFYVLTLPSLGRTFAFDAAASGAAGTAVWHERQSGTSLTPAPWDVQCIFEAFGKTLVGLQGGKVAELDLDTYTDLGEPIRSAIVSVPFFGEGTRAMMVDYEVECELGIGASSGQGQDPQLMMRYSDDGGSTWSSERQASLGALGVRLIRAMWERLGTFRQRTVEISISDPVKRCFYGMRTSIKPLSR
jgi:hypothetical protein